MLAQGFYSNMNKIALSLLTIVALAIHLDWHDWTLARSFSQAQQSAVAVALSSLNVPDVSFKSGESPFGGWFQGAIIDCNQAPSTPEDIKRSEKDSKYWDGQIQKCVDEFMKEYNGTAVMTGLLDRLEGQSHFRVHMTDLGSMDVTVNAGLSGFTAPVDTVQEAEHTAKAKYITVQVTVHEPRWAVYNFVFANKYSIDDEVTGRSSVEQLTLYFPDQQAHLYRVTTEDLEDLILNSAAQQGGSATDWKEAYRHLRVSIQSESYKLPLLDVDAPASIVAAVLFLIAAGSLNQLHHAIGRGRIKALVDEESDEAFWLETFKQSRFLRLGYRLAFIAPLIILWLSFEVWSRNGFTARRALTISIELILVMAVAIEAWICVTIFQQFLRTEPRKLEK